ncbi:L-prolyl-[peptidyl carrier protein] dehydrogenase [Nocardia tenerifensis]|uniref:L-prolyl-[peptidyl carrier protein] dehydrogenase n=1 Tax=Nocardia tenerifensis TaxID=228006 RepID=A0A318KCF4_9NOCA|nr:acyl-CoA dehydrogenase family protein [Nocardia tenerifensis]PXX56297.1 L-prolyl-[peptidyl carrier protein] dehydrogenase [Nocardia tenerifensis]
MDFELSPGQRELRTRIIDFARAELGGELAESDRTGTLAWQDWKRCAEFGVLGWPVPAEYGGSGLDPLSVMIALEALGYGCPDNGLVFAINNHLWGCVIYLLEHGSRQQKERYLPRLCSGALVGAHALSEPEAGSDVLSMRTTAVRDGEHYILNGTKWFVSNGPTAGLYVVFARTGGAGRSPNRLSAFLVPADLPGVRKSRRFGKMGLRGTEMGEIEFVDCRVPVADLIGTEGAGYPIFTGTIEWERSFMFAAQAGAMQRLLDRSIEHARSREQFGRPIGAFQGISHKIADMKIRLELSRLILYRVGWLKSQGRFALEDATIAKIFVSESLVQTAMAAMEIHGARGYLDDFGIERELRDALGGPIYAGSSSVQRGVLAELLGVRGGLAG